MVEGQDLYIISLSCSLQFPSVDLYKLFRGQCCPLHLVAVEVGAWSSGMV